MAGLKARGERDMRMRRARLAGAAAQTHPHGLVTQDSILMFQRTCGVSDAAVMPAHSAEQRETAPVRSPAERAHISSAAASCLRSRTAADDVADPSG